uniref:Uncharacterized protein n=1 Tax=Anopheles dirus TaxID=7168 RepID=A0A182NMJ0_9DIPT
EEWLNATDKHSASKSEHPNKKQIAARHVIGKDLPYFSGDPKEWAMWYSGYLQEQSLCYQELVAKYPHLKGLPIADYKKIVPKMLIGMDNLNLIVPLKVREGALKEPIAVKCKLGWSIYERSQSASGVGLVGYHKEKCSTDMLTTLVRQYVIQDNLNISETVKLIESEEDTRAREILEATTRRVGKRYETGLLWKNVDPTFPS